MAARWPCYAPWIGNDVRIDMAQKRRQDGWTDLRVVIDLAPSGYGNVDQILRVRL